MRQTPKNFRKINEEVRIYSIKRQNRKYKTQDVSDKTYTFLRSNTRFQGVNEIIETDIKVFSENELKIRIIIWVERKVRKGIL